MVDYTQVSVLGIVAAAAANMALGAFWYSPYAFGKQWLALIGKRMEDLGDPRAGYALGALGALLASTALAVIILAMGATHWIDGLGVGAAVGAAIVAPVMAVDYVFAGRSVQLYLLNTTYHVVAFTAMGAIIGAIQ